MPFRPGESGNPLGRPPTGLALAEYIRQIGGDDGRVYIDALHEIATTHKDAKTRITAMQILLDRGFGGKSVQTLELKESESRQPLIPLDKLSDEESALLEKIYGKAGPPIIETPLPRSSG